MLAARACLAASLCAAACSPTSPSSDPPSNLPRITCPGSQISESLDGNAVTVNYPAPVVTGGTAPITVTCSPPSGSAFTVGRTDVGCGVVDSRDNGASCTFSVTVNLPPRLSATRFVAFGDSITYGSSAECAFGLRGANPLDRRLLDVQSLWANADAAAAYPSVLQGLLTARYRAQSPSVVNAGVPGETVTATGTQSRLSASLSQSSAEVLLLQEGVNDLHGDSTPSAVADALTSMVRSARGRGVRVFLGTLLPERAGACRAFAPDEIQPTNALIRSLATAEGVPLVDLYSAFVGRESTLLGQDGLHPSPAGYEEMAREFFDAIRSELEVTSEATSIRPLRPPAG
jgi:acyl-CoA thioesterase-1